MAPKVKVNYEDIVNGALWLVRSEGVEALNARSLARVLDCTIREVESGIYPVYKASGMAYIRFAKEECELFKLLFMRDRSGEVATKEAGFFDRMEAVVQKNVGLESDKARLFHLEMWAYVHGIAVMFATGYLNLDWELVSQMLTDSYLGLKKQYETE